MTTGEKIKQKRLEKGYTQATLAKMLGVSQSAVTQFERSKGILRMGTIGKIADVLGCKKEDLLPDILNPVIIYDSEKAEQQLILNDIKESPLLLDYLYLFYCLNDSGREEALRLVKLVEKVPEYRVKGKVKDSALCIFTSEEGE